MADLSYQQSLIQAGLAKDQAAVYETLVKRGLSLASDVAYAAGVSRPLTYKVLDELIALGLVEKKEEPKKVARFEAAHPLKLKDVAQKRVEEARDAESALEGVLGKLTSDFNLRSGKPGVQFFEGREGTLKILWDSLNATEEIYTYMDIETIAHHAAKENEEYVQARIKKGIPKKILVPDTPFARAWLMSGSTPLTDVRLLSGQRMQPLNVAIEIYNGTISYLAFSEQSVTGTLIRDPSICTMHRYLFECAWQTALTVEDVKRQGSGASQSAASQ